MEKPHKIVISIVAVVLYCLAASGFSDGKNYSIDVDQDVETSGFAFFVAEELPFANDFAIKESASFWSGGNLTPGSFKQSQVYKAVKCALDVKVACSILQSVSQLHSNPVRIRKSDMLFPFHYFFEPDRT